ncbi:uncharacterized protein G2W53_025718 [Senna tora]|uniref:Uncharacterized protein n=1 Tax=Senna tora TaxID=362788 RepID=A0A834WGS2_9FABA|nr:uncharacterized protein G2W53_025718 [Senna tora]
MDLRFFVGEFVTSNMHTRKQLKLVMRVMMGPIVLRDIHNDEAGPFHFLASNCQSRNKL